ncbi:MAG: CapA family protein [Butyricimonas virosa]|uniref:CapA family protein n=1 Tax=Butyricimonas virosa TaxID=544645 RepID=UPI00242D134F|nr:CapA family protein [Butyricimonas virosa]MCI7293683.1 CapA family protein [Butyricimonas virosa]
MNDKIIKIFISGDFAPRLRVNDVIDKEEYAQLYGDILPIIREADYSITNLEAPLIEKGTPIAKTGPNLKAPIKSIEALKFAGISMVTLANNHIMDYGEEGLLLTMDLCKKNNIDYIGVGKKLEEAQEVKYVLIKNTKIAFINVAENEWSTTDGDKMGANPLNEVDVYYQILEAKRNSDSVILIIHGGHETYELPSPRMKRLYRWFIDLGVDAVIGHHTHCFSGDEVYKGKPIVYSLGNFIFDHPTNRDNYWNFGTAVVVELNNGHLKLHFYPFEQCNNKVGVSLLAGKNKEQWFQKQKMKKEIILSDEMLNQQYNLFIETQKKMYGAYLEPVKNKYVLAAMNRGFFSRFIKGAKKRLYLNIIRCEAHRDILLKILSQQ